MYTCGKYSLRDLQYSTCLSKHGTVITTRLPFNTTYTCVNVNCVLFRRLTQDHLCTFIYACVNANDIHVLVYVMIKHYHSPNTYLYILKTKHIRVHFVFCCVFLYVVYAPNYAEKRLTP